MKFTSLLKRWAGIGIVTACAVDGHLYSTEHREWLAENLFAPTYAAPSDDAALARGMATQKIDAVKAHRDAASWQECAERFEDVYISLYCHQQPAAFVPKDRAGLILYGKELHRKLFVYKAVDPHLKTVETGINWTFGTIYFIAALLALQASIKWFAAEALPKIKRSYRTAREVVPIGSNLGKMNARRKLHQAEKDFQTLKNLHDNQLISDEMFAEKKAAIVSVLNENTASQNRRAST